MKAIIIDDSRAMRMIIGRIFRELGYELLEAGNGAEALDVLGKNSDVAIAVVDWNMPVMDGYEFVAEVRKNRARDRMPILMVTTESQPEHVARAKAAGANEYLSKPFTADGVKAKLDRLGLTKAP